MEPTGFHGVAVEALISSCPLGRDLVQLANVVHRILPGDRFERHRTVWRDEPIRTVAPSGLAVVAGRARNGEIGTFSPGDGAVV
jgi:hypothetical protein